MVDKREALYRAICDTTDLLNGGIRTTHPDWEEYAALLDGNRSDDVPGDASGDDPDSARHAKAGREPQRPRAVPPPSRDGRQSADLTPEERKRRLDEIAEQISGCTACRLYEGRTFSVPGTGVLDPLVMVIGEGPGGQEDRQGIPFVGPAGQYLDKWLESIGLSRRTNVFIGNIVKCRPPGNRDPHPDESDACMPYLREQIDLVRPRLILTVGRISTRILTGTAAGITSIHGKLYEFEGLPLLPTFHPSAVLRNPGWRRPVWEDMKALHEWLTEHTEYEFELGGSGE